MNRERKRAADGALRYTQAGKRVLIPEAARAAMPVQVEPMLATLVNKPFVDPEWIFETKWDGVRAVCFVENGTARFVSRRRQEMSFRYPELRRVAGMVKRGQAILDGEIVAFDERGAARFQLLQQRIGVEEPEDIERRVRTHPVVYVVFDLLYYDGYDLTAAPLLARKGLLEAVLKPGGAIRLSKHTRGDGVKAFARAEREDLEGIVAKHGNSIYVPGRSEQWLKIKTQKRQEVVIGGYTAPKGAREYFGSLAVGLYRGAELVYVGNVGGGFDRRSLKQLYTAMQALKTARSPFAAGTQPNEHVQWLKPKLVCEVKFAEWTAERQMRQPIFMGLRDDKPPRDCILEVEHSTRRTVQRAEGLRR